MADWERSERFEEWPSCRGCVHYDRARCIAYPHRIPLIILSGEVDHYMPRPGQVGDTVFEPLDLQHWLKTKERRPLAEADQTAEQPAPAEAR
jgi:hypothetical protein